MKLKNVTQIVSLLLVSFVMSACDNATAPSQQSNILQCAVRDADIGMSYQGECKSGYANGLGVAKGKDTYTGSFKNGLIHGQGKYEWGPTTEWADEVWEGISYKGERTGYGSITLGPKSKHFFEATGDYAVGEVLADGRRIIRGTWARGGLSKALGDCKSEAECYGGLAKLEEAIRPVIEVVLQTQLKDRVFTLAELPYLLASKKDPSSLLRSCLALENIELFKETNSRVVVDAQDLSNMIKVAAEPKLLLSSWLECDLRVRQNEDFLSKLNPYQGITATELRASMKWLVGKKVKVSGKVVSILNNFMFKEGPTDTNPIFLETKNTGRRVILSAMESCSSNLIHGCTAVVFGTVENTDIGVGIFLENIDIIKKAEQGVY